MPMETQHLTVMFTDIKGFTDRSSHQTRDELVRLLALHDRLIRPIFKRFGGTVVKTIGDAFLVTFKSPTNAVHCGVAVQKALRGHNEHAAEGERLEVRVAINSGEATVMDGDVYGEPVNIAARIEGIAEANEIYFTEAVYLAMNKNEIPTAEIGYHHLKGIPHQIKVYKVAQESPGVLAPMPPFAADAGAPASAPAFIQSPSPSAGAQAAPPASAAPYSWPQLILIALAGAVLFKPTVAAIQGLNQFFANLFAGPGGIILVALYLYFSYCLYELAKRLGTPHEWMAAIPLLNVFYAISLADRPNWWYLGYLVPGLNIALILLTWIAFAKKMRAPAWTGVLVLVPAVGMLLPRYFLSASAKPTS